MNILEWLNENISAWDALIYCLVALLIWIVLWKVIIVRIFEKKQVYSIIELGALGSFGILLLLALVVVLFIASIQAAGQYGSKIVLPIILFWAGIITFAIFFVTKMKKK